MGITIPMASGNGRLPLASRIGPNSPLLSNRHQSIKAGLGPMVALLGQLLLLERDPSRVVAPPKMLNLKIE